MRFNEEPITEGGSAMYYAGIDYHKRYSFVSIQDESGTVVHEQRVEWNNPAVFAQMFNQLQHEVTVVRGRTAPGAGEDVTGIRWGLWGHSGNGQVSHSLVRILFMCHIFP